MWRSMGSKILFIAALHGDEGFGVDALKEIEKKLDKERYKYDWVIGNPKAYGQNTRYTETDLNRIAPGNSASEIYEERRAAELVALSKDFDYVIDIHGTTAKSGVFVLVTNPSTANLMLAACMPLQNVVVWAADVSKKCGPVTQYAKCPAIEIECGPKDDKKIRNKISEVVENIIKTKSRSVSELMKNIVNQKYFYVTGSIENIDTTDMKEFEKTQVDGEEFYPLLINSYKIGSARKMKRIDFFGLLSY